ncbi:tRNA splicing endonuclease subunit sen2 [Rhizina undulata]
MASQTPNQPPPAATTAEGTSAPAPNRPRYKKPNYNLLHANPLPLTASPLPPLIPHNPLSLLHIIWAYFFAATQAHPKPLYSGVFNRTTGAIHVTDARSIQAFWNSGFFGKGSLSRSEPTWVIRRRRALGVIGIDEALTAEEVTERRRGERKEFKRERARAEREKLEKRLAEEGKLAREAAGINEDGDDSGGVSLLEPEQPVEKPDGDAKEENGTAKSVTFAPVGRRKSVERPQRPVVDVEDLEHLQLTIEEAFFLSYGLGALKITDSATGVWTYPRRLLDIETDIGAIKETIPQKDLLPLFRENSYFPALAPGSELQPDDPFMVNYVVYHHFRSLGWVVKPGIKFAVDYLLYNRGPVFSHAEFAVLVLPAYSHPYWASDEARKQKERKPWHWLHCINRVSSQVKKTVILIYVEIPPPLKEAEKGLAVDNILKKYAVREVGLRRWLVSRNRD